MGGVGRASRCNEYKAMKKKKKDKSLNFEREEEADGCGAGSTSWVRRDASFDAPDAPKWTLGIIIVAFLFHPVLVETFYLFSNTSYYHFRLLLLLLLLLLLFSFCLL